MSTLGTDRHPQITALMKKEYPAINHQFDIWHLAKSLSKKLRHASSKKEWQDLGLWKKSIINHLWWCSQTCGNSAIQIKVCYVSWCSRFTLFGL